MLGDDIAAILPDLQAQAESLMVDTCKVTTSVPGAWDDATGTYGDPVTTTVYEGVCQLPRTYPNAQDADAGEATWAVGIVTIKLPVRALPDAVGDPLAVTDGHDVEVTSRTGLSMTVRFAIPQTFEKSRDVSCQVVSRDA